jgi:hypothetical protein
MRKQPVRTLSVQLATAALLVALAVPAGAQLVFDSNVLYNNGSGSYSTDSGGAACPGGAYSVTDLAETLFTNNRTVDPLLNAQRFNLSDPRWDLQAGSPALGSLGAPISQASNLDPWFQDVCYQGGVGYTGGVDADDWTTGWTYYNQQGGVGRTDIDTGKTAVMVTTDITVNTTWDSTSNYMLVGRIGVTNGATLTINEGTVVMGSGVGSFLVIERDGNIDVNGTREHPVVFTSSGDFTLGNQAPGDWGGIVIHGNAQANCAGVTGCGLTDPNTQCESEGGAGFFGGNDDDDSSGSIQYARVEYSGQEISPNNELNSWTFNAVGRNTVVEHLQAHFGTDDGFEWFGGTARSRWLVATSCSDDNIDWQMGFRGFIQFAVVQQNPAFSLDKGIEADNNEFDFNCAGRSNPTLSHLTFVGTGGQGGGTIGIHLRRGTSATIVNSIISDFTTFGLRVQHEETFANCAGTAPGLGGCTVAGVGGDSNGGRTFAVAAGPNPSFGASTLSFNLSNDSRVTVRIFDAAGRLVDTLADGHMTAGRQTVTWSPDRQASGTYFYQVIAGAERATGRLLVLK